MHTSNITGLIPISIATLCPDVPLGVNIYLRSRLDAPPVLFMPFHEIPNVSKLTTLTSNRENKLFIDREEYGRYQEYLRKNWKLLAADEWTSVAQRLALLSEVMRDILERSYKTAQADTIVPSSQQIARHACELLAHEPILTRDLCSVLHHDYATFTHSTNVSLYALLLARELGFRGGELEQIVSGALLHDIGKLEIDERILNKPGRLDEFELRQVQRHPTTGFRTLVSREDLNRAQLMMVYQHHERIDGSGYPVGCTGEEIHPWARLCAVVDVFEALTSDRPYRLSMTHKTAWAIMDKGEGTEFDADILACWRSMVSQKA